LLTVFVHFIQTIKEGIEGHAVSWYSEVFDLVFPNLDRQKANTCKICEWKAEQKKKKKDDSESKEEDD
jgi:Lon-like ATP-dependent protease